jgi:hypothetical protein
MPKTQGRNEGELSAMGMVQIQEAQAGMVVAAEVRDRTGRLLMVAGQEVSDRALRVLRMWGVAEIDVADRDHPAVAELFQLALARRA